MMDFDGKDSVMQKISNNGALTQKLQQAQAQLMQLAQIVDHDRGTNLAQSIAASIMGQPCLRRAAFPLRAAWRSTALAAQDPKCAASKRRLRKGAANQASPR